MSDKNEIWVVLEPSAGDVRPVSRELIARARSLADASGGRVVAVALGTDVGGQASGIAGLGADEMIAVEHAELASYRTRPWVDALVQVAGGRSPGLILVPASVDGRELAASLAAALDTGIAADCLEIDWDGGPVGKRPVYGNRLVDTVRWTGSGPAVASMRPRAYDDPGAGSGDAPPVTAASVEIGAESLDVEDLGFRADEGESVNLADADVIVAGGRGLQAPENFSLVRDLAEALGGAVGASRAVVDSGWIPYPHQVGQTGKTVRPKLYVAAGISGAIQHLAGMKTAETIVTINKDANAPIFKISTWGLVGDALEILPKLTAKIRERKG